MSRSEQLKIKVGLILMDRRTYLVLWCLGFLIWVGIGVFVGQCLGPGTRWGDAVRRNAPWFLAGWPYLFWGALSVSVFEAAVILRRFRTRREFVRREGLSVDDVRQA